MDTATALLSSGIADNAAGMQMSMFVMQIMTARKDLVGDTDGLQTWEDTCSNDTRKVAALLILPVHQRLISSLAAMTSKASEHLDRIVSTAPYHIQVTYCPSVRLHGGAYHCANRLACSD